MSGVKTKRACDFFLGPNCTEVVNYMMQEISPLLLMFVRPAQGAVQLSLWAHRSIKQTTLALLNSIGNSTLGHSSHSSENVLIVKLREYLYIFECFGGS